MADDPEPSPVTGNGPAALGRKARHWGGFLASGGIAFLVDWAVLEACVGLLRWNPFTARIVAIAVAMVAGWLAHRTLTFAVAEQPSLGEFLKYASAAWMAAGLNYLIFALALLLVPDVPRLAALVAGSLGAMIFSYVAMRYAVFRYKSKNVRL